MHRTPLADIVNLIGVAALLFVVVCPITPTPNSETKPPTAVDMFSLLILVAGLLQLVADANGRQFFPQASLELRSESTSLNAWICSWIV